MEVVIEPLTFKCERCCDMHVLYYADGRQEPCPNCKKTPELKSTNYWPFPSVCPRAYRHEVYQEENRECMYCDFRPTKPIEYKEE